MKNLPKKTAATIKKLLAEQNKTPETLAYEIGMSKSFMYDFLNGKSDICLRNLQKIADGLEVTADELLK
ncbi:helix-turn-helix transcriptional regulator [bacterium]|nr:helix-turn-helix transcriptional regulator [bacterium]